MNRKKVKEAEIQIIKELREEGVTVENISLKMRFHKNTVLKVLQGEHTPNPSKIPKGRKLCVCCHKRLVPKRPVKNVELRILCYYCYVNEENNDEDDFRVCADPDSY